MWCWQFVIGIWMCVVRCCYLETLFTASSTDVQNIVAYSYNVKVSLLKCVTACWFSTWWVKRASIFNLILYPSIIVDHKSGPFGGNLDKNAKNWLEQGALVIFWRFLTPGNKWCLDWSWFQTIYPIPIFDILFPFPVTKSQSQWLKSHFPRAKTGQSQFPFYPFRTLLEGPNLS